MRGRRALVTGARGLGAEIARQLAEEGASVAVTYRQAESEANDLVAELEASHGSRFAVAQVEVLDPESVTAGLGAAARGLAGPIDVLVNNVGPWVHHNYLEMSIDEWRNGMDGNLTAAFLTSRAAAPGMIEQGWGRIVNISAGSAYHREHSVYSLAKNALIILTEQLALELAPAVTVNAVAPGQILESTPDMEAEVPKSVDELLSSTPSGRFVTRREVARMVVAFCGPLFDSVTGHTVPMDGGARLKGNNND